MNALPVQTNIKKLEQTLIQHELQNALNKLDQCLVECDGFTRLASTLLQKIGIQHTCYVGSLHQILGGFSHIPMHYWIEVGDFIVDYRAQMWLGSEAPHGVFTKESCSKFFYNGKPVQFAKLTDSLFSVLAGFSPIASSEAALSYA